MLRAELIAGRGRAYHAADRGSEGSGRPVSLGATSHPERGAYAIRTVLVREMCASWCRVSFRRCSMSELFDAVDALLASRAVLPPPAERKRLRAAHGLTIEKWPPR
ncbi:hypothetical protein Shyd_56420 [Streptomyces hydrogenans]|uniref:Uncharacterized protein n=1 Tax=Streptomyces hydrogenans TaxID=1873719 RepID=A0ABQ3PGX1_9ACTN|nr:hypothetical protein Shyd_56420 [Streptomyces hydrogenans]